MYPNILQLLVSSGILPQQILRQPYLQVRMHRATMIYPAAKDRIITRVELACSSELVLNNPLSHMRYISPVIPSRISKSTSKASSFSGVDEARLWLK
jgi:hypothetical protein